MKLSNPFVKCSHLTALSLLGALIAWLPANAAGNSVRTLFQESFETDGEEESPPRYTTTGRAVYEVPRIESELGLEDQKNPLYWAHNFEVSNVGVAIDAPARRAVFTWHHSIPPDAVTDDARDLIDAIIDWLAENRQEDTVHFATGGPDQPGDSVIVNQLEGKGFTVTAGGEVPEPSSVAFLVVSSAAADNTLTDYEAPLLTYNASGHDDLLVSSIGETDTLTIDNFSITSPDGAAGDLSGDDFGFVEGEQTFDLPGVRLPEEATVTASAQFAGAAPVEELATVDAMAAGSQPSETTSGQLFDGADLALGAGGVADINTPVPGDPTGGFGTVASGTLEVSAAGTYTFALGVDDGARLRIDLDRNGIDSDDDVIVFDRQGGFDFDFEDVTFSETGSYDFEWIAFNSEGAFGSEVWVHTEEGGGRGAPVELGDDPANAWVWLADWRQFGLNNLPINLSGPIDVTTYVLDAPPVLVERPLLVTLETGARLLGGEIVGQEGDGFFAGAGLDKFPGDVPRTLRLPPVDVSGQENVKLTFMIAGTDLDFEPSDYFDVWIDTSNTGDFERLVRFTAPSGDDKFITDGNVRVGNRFKTATYDIPEEATDLVVEFRALTTWFNEVVAFDNIQITSGTDIVLPTVSIRREGEEAVIEFNGVLQSAEEIVGPFEDIAEPDESPHAVELDGTVKQRFYRARQP